MTGAASAARPGRLGMNHAAVRTLAAAVAGVAVCAAVHCPAWMVAGVAILSLAAARLTRGLTLYLAVAAAVFLYARVRVPEPPAAALFAVPRFQGVVVDEPVPGGPLRATVQLAPPLRGRVQVWLADSEPQLRYGDAVAVECAIRPLDFPRNFGLADYNRLFERRGVVGTTSAHAGEITIVGRGRGQLLGRVLIMPVRRYVMRTADRLLPGDEGALLLGLLLGGSRGLSQAAKDSFSEAGLVHILAVSGMNVAVVVGIAWLLLSVLGVRGWWRFGLGVAVVFFYVSLAGWSAAPARSGLMSCAALVALPAQRRVSALASLSVAALVLLLLDPWVVLDVGAQLSFAATLGIVLVAGRLEGLPPVLKRSRRLYSWVILPSFVSLAATTATAPLMLHHFFRVQPLAFLTSLAVVPLVGLAMPLGIVVVLANLVSHGLAGIFAASAWLVLRLTLALTAAMGRLDWAIWEPGRVSWAWVAWFYGAGLLALQLRKPWARVALPALVCAGLNLAVWPSALHRPGTTVTFLDPKRGDAILLQDSLGRLALVDAGINGTGVVRDFLRSRGIHRIDVAVVTHPDNDHYGGLLDLDARQRISRLLVSADTSGDTAYTGLLRRLAAAGTQVITVGRGTTLSGLGFGVRFIWPDARTAAMFRQGRAPTNSVSLVARVEHAGFRMLFTGDMEDPDLLAGDSLQADLLKSPHHGSKKGNPQLLYDAVRPAHVVVMGRFPTPAGLEQRFAGSGVDYVNTRRDGALAVAFAGSGPRFIRYDTAGW